MQIILNKALPLGDMADIMIVHASTDRARAQADRMMDLINLGYCHTLVIGFLLPDGEGIVFHFPDPLAAQAWLWLNGRG